VKRTLKQSIQQQRESLEKSLITPLSKIAFACEAAWPDRQKLDDVLLKYLESIPNCTFLYALDTDGIQISDNISSSGLLPEHFGRDRSQRPYMKELVPVSGFLLSEAYISLRVSRPSLTALQVIRKNDEVVGFLGADFDLRNLPVTAEIYDEPAQWRQIKGDVAIRSTLFQQTRADSLLDKEIDQAMSILEELCVAHGMFQSVIHFSSSRATIWLMNDPYRYHILQAEELSDPDIVLAYPTHEYPNDAIIPESAINDIFNNMKQLRFTDENIYLRSASINIFNGMVSLTFSCDGSHYMPYNEFIDKNINFWVGSTA